MAENQTNALIKALNEPNTLASIQKSLPECPNKSSAAQRLVRIVQTMIRTDTKGQLSGCTKGSVIGAVLRCAQMGLNPDPSAAECYFIPYKDTCTFMLGYKGLLKVALRSGDIKRVEAHVVHEFDTFEYELGFEPRLMHRPNLGADPGEMVAVYAIAFFKNGDKQFEVLTKSEVQKVQLASKASDSGPWKEWFEEMAKKTAFKRLSKYLPLSTDLADALATDTRAELGVGYTETGDVAAQQPQPEVPAGHTPEYKAQNLTLEQYVARCIKRAKEKRGSEANAEMMMNFFKVQLSGSDLAYAQTVVDREFAEDIQAVDVETGEVIKEAAKESKKSKAQSEVTEPKPEE